MKGQYIEESLRVFLLNKASTLDGGDYCSAKRLISSAQRSYEILQKYYHDHMGYDSLSTAQRIISDNQYRLCEAVNKAVLKLIQVKTLIADKDGIPSIYKLMYEAFANKDFELSTNSMLELIGIYEQKTYLKNLEYGWISTYGVHIAAAMICEQIESEEFESEVLSHAIKLFYGALSLSEQQLIRQKNRLDAFLREDEIYNAQTAVTQNHYRYMISIIAMRKGEDELLIARNLFKESENEHFGFMLYRQFARYQRYKQRQAGLFLMQYILPLIICVGLMLVLPIYLPLILYIPLVELVRPWSEHIAAMGLMVSNPPQMDFKGKIPDDCKTLVTLSTILPDKGGEAELASRLKSLYLRNRTKGIYYAVLADLKPSSSEALQTDDDAISASAREIAKLNNAYGERFILLVRKREYSKTQKGYIGRGRKRGAISDLVAAARGGNQDFLHTSGNVEAIASAKYLLALDYDTELLLDDAKTLIEIARHPMNSPLIETDEESGKKKIVRGYGIIEPAVRLGLKASTKNGFTRTMGGVGGISCYDVGDIEFSQLLFGRTIFTGKGLIDIDAYHELLNGKLESEAILSHDILEGAMLRTLYAGNVELTESFPKTVIAYFKRLHRWIRGDFQNSSFIFDSELSGYDRYRIFDNIRRALTTAATFACTVIAGFAIARWEALLVVIIALLSICSPYIQTILVQLTNGNRAAFIAKHFSKTMSELTHTVVKAVVECAALPQYAFVSAAAGIKGLWRRYVTKRNLLEWATASQIGMKRNSVFSEMLFCLPCIIAGILLLFSRNIFGLIVGVLYLFGAIFMAFSSHHTASEGADISRSSRVSLISDLQKMLEYYKELGIAEENFLPPDNIQFSPVERVAHRTSPTNIGLMLLSYLTERDFDLVSTAKLYENVQNVIATVKKLEKFNGNLYNWYDTQTLKVLPPGFVSTVDSGNFLCCLIALKEGLREYQAEQPKLCRIIEDIETLIAEADLSCFYSEEKNLFSIGYDTVAGELHSSCYDMLMSEARMTSYFAIAKGYVPKKHWSSLARISTVKDGYAGAISWTGTMFEYFMPELLLHCIKGSMGYENLSYCLYCQKSRTEGMGVYGISESGIYRFDGELNYQYEANGVQRIAMKTGMNNSLVISPYSTYITLSMDYKAACANIRALKKLNAEGEYGLYEALDYTKERIGENEFRAVNSYMAHHLGMSIVAINNALHLNIMQKRFLRDEEMSSASELLTEIPSVGIMSKRELIRREQAHSSEDIQDELQYVGQLHPASPNAYLLSNDILTSVLTDVGVAHIQARHSDITRRTEDMLKEAAGVFCFAMVDDEIISSTYAPSYSQMVRYETAFGNGEVLYSASSDTIKIKTQVHLHRMLPCEQRKLSITNKTSAEQEVKLLFYIEPTLIPNADFFSHKAFSKLFVNIEYDKEKRVVIASRRKRGSEEQYYLAVGFMEWVDFELESNRENVFARGDISMVTPEIFTKELSGDGGIPDPCIAIRTSIKLSPNETRQLNLLCSISRNRDGAAEHIVSLRSSGGIGDYNFSKSRFVRGSIEERVAQTLIPQVVYNKRGSLQNRIAIEDNVLSAEALWGLSISCDYPIVVVDIINEQDTERMNTYVICQSLLRLSGIRFDLVFLFDRAENSETQPVREKLLEVVEKHGSLQMLASKGGVYIFDTTEISEELKNLLYAYSCHIAPRSMVFIEKPLPQYIPQIPLRAARRMPEISETIVLDGGVFTQKSFFVTQTPKLPWCHVLANPVFGTLLSDRSLGFSWAINSRENKLTPWSNDTRYDFGGEKVLLRYGGASYDLADGATAEYNPLYARYHGLCRELETVMTVTVPASGMIKYIELEITNVGAAPQEAEICYYTEPVMHSERKHAKLFKSELRNNALIIQNPMKFGGNAYMALSAIGEQFDFTCDRTGFLCGAWDAGVPAPIKDCCAAITVKKRLNPNQAVKLKLALCFSMTIEGIEGQLRKLPNVEYKNEFSLNVETDDKAVDLMVNTWLPHQMLNGRIYGRTGFYQCGGAYGFRDQLQDVINYLPLSKKLAKRHIARCCSVQFEAGDVLHWWHSMPNAGGGRKGIRTKYSDDYIWLCYAVARYVEETGDNELLDMQLRYLKGEDIPNGVKDIYLTVEYTDFKESVYEHCKRALKRAMTRLGSHGLPLIGSGDWNDGYSNVGAQGNGESIWLAQFLSLTLKSFSKHCCNDDLQLANEYNSFADKLLASVDEHCFDNDHYLRAFFDSGKPMGSYDSEECMLDSLTQSFSAISDMPDSERVKTALHTAYSLLVDERQGIIKLFTPAFESSSENPGYVMSYPVGIRENGGQYTHAAVWFAMAFRIIGENEQFMKLAQMLNPISKYKDNEASESYMVEPYYVTADIYTNPYCYGRGGWSIYTGASGWYYTLLLQYVLSVGLRGGRLTPAEMPPLISGKINFTDTKTGELTQLKLEAF